jgi:hypothetical protein
MSDRATFWRRHIARQQQSQLGIKEYCQRFALHQPSFFQWRKRLGLNPSATSAPRTPAPPKRTPSARSASARFVAVPVVARALSVARIEIVLQSRVRAGHLFVFVNRRADSVKILGWDRDGLAIWYKRLERGSFRFNTTSHGHCELTSLDLQLVLAGIDPARAPRQKRFELRAQ